jgi:hypothetical protein
MLQCERKKEEKSCFWKRLADERLPEWRQKKRKTKCFWPRKNMQKSRNQTFLLLFLKIIYEEKRESSS